MHFFEADFRLHCQGREISSRIFSIPNSGMGGCDLIPPIQTRFSVRRMSTSGGTFVFFHWKSFVRFPYQRQEKHEWVCRSTVWGTAITKSFRISAFFWQSRVSQGIPSSNVLDAAVRKTRKAVQEEKHVPPEALHETAGKPQTVNSGESISPIFPEKIS